MPAQQSPNATFQDAIETASHLQWKAGLKAIKRSEGGGKISGADPRRVLGGAAIDDDCQPAHPNAHRWDYVVGYERSKRAVAYFIEVHSAETSEVSRIAKKLEWLRQFLRQEAQEKLARLSSEFHWVASGRINIPRHVPQFRYLETTLRARGLKGPVKQLTLI
jgi:hypothetical protein